MRCASSWPTTPRSSATGYLASHAHATDMVELHLLLPAHQFSALEAAAARSGLTVAALLRRTVGDFLCPPRAAGTV